jgi:cell division protein FtsQ
VTPPSPSTGSKTTSSIDPRIRQRRNEIQRHRGRRRLRWVLAVVAVAVLVAGGIALLHTSILSARVVTVTGAHPHTPAATIEVAAGLNHRPPLISVDPGAVARRVETLPFIASAQVHRHWPDGVQIAVTERVPVLQMAGPSTSWSTLDGQGRTLEVRPARAPGLLVLIVRTPTGGVPPAGVGGTVPSEADVGLTVCRTLPAAFSAQVVSVTVAADSTVTLALNSGLTVLMGTDADLTAKYEDVAAIIANGSLRGAKTIDVTVPQSPAVGR